MKLAANSSIVATLSFALFATTSHCVGQDVRESIPLDAPVEKARAPGFGPGAVAIVLKAVPLKDSGRVVGQAAPGTLYRVKRIRGKWAELAVDRGTAIGWLRVDQLAGRDDAGEEIDRRLRADPNDADALVTRGRMRMDDGEVVDAKDDFERARRADPLASEPLYWLARMALADSPRDAEKLLTEAIGVAPEDARLFAWRAWLRGENGDFAGRRADLEAKVKLGKASIADLRALAWEYAVHPDAAVRNGKRAVEYAKKANELEESRSDEGLEVLAAANAEDGQFIEAVQAQRQLVARNREDDQGYVDSSRMRDYQSNAAIRETQDQIWKKFPNRPID